MSNFTFLRLQVHKLHAHSLNVSLEDSFKIKNKLKNSFHKQKNNLTRLSENIGMP